MKERCFLAKKNLMKITTIATAFLVAITLISSSSVSVTINKMPKIVKQNLEEIEEETSIMNEQSNGLAPNVAVDNHDIPKVSLTFKGIMRGYIANSSVFDEGTCYFEVDNPEDIIYLHDTESDDFLSGGTGVCGDWIACENSTGALWEIDPETGDMTYIGGGGVGLNGLAHDFTINILYGASGSDLYIIDIETGDQELIGSFGSSVNEMIGIAADWEGNLYGWDLGDKLWIIDKETGDATEVGPLGIDLNYAQDGGFDLGEYILYLTAFTVSPNYGSYLYTCDLETGGCTLIGQLEGNSQITASVVSLGWYWNPHDVGVKDIISPKDGVAGENIEVIVQVKNYGNSSEYDVPVNVVILKDGIDAEYNETEYVDIGWGETVDVEMPSWTPDDWQSASNEYINYKITAYTSLYGDGDPDNDYKEKWFELYFGHFHDVGCTGVSGPENGPAQTFSVTGHIKNFGQYDECCFKTYVEIAELNTEDQEELLTQDFSDSTFPPTGWTRTHSNWMYSDSSYAGGTSGEARFNWNPSSTDLFRLYTSAIDTSDYDAIEIEFKHYVNHWSGPYTLKVETSPDGVSWSTVWEKVNPGSGQEDVYFVTGDNVGSDTLYVSWTFEGNSYNINYWYIDDIVINGFSLSDPEYEDVMCIDYIDPGEEVFLEFDDWTPEFLSEETSGTKIYSVKGWTELEDSEDENPDNDLFAKTIELDFFHDVRIKEVTNPRIHSIWPFDYWLHYDDETTVNAFGCSCSCTFEYAIRLTPDELNCYPGYYISRVKRHHSWITPFQMSGKIKIYKEGSSTHPGDLITEEPFECYDADWHEIKLSEPVEIAGDGDIWISCEVSHEAGQYPAGMDPSGPVDGKSDWLYFNSEWVEAYVYGIYTDWNLWVGITLAGGPPQPMACIQPGIQDINVTVENIGTFPELDLTCYAKIWEHITDPINGTLVYEDNIIDIDLEEPLGGTEYLEFDDYNFSMEGIYRLSLNMPDEDDDKPRNNKKSVRIDVDDTLPYSTHEFDPRNPDGENGWYVTDVEVTLSASDPYSNEVSSGVNFMKYKIGDGSWQTISGDRGTFILNEDGDNLQIQYYAVDNVGNQESTNSFTIDMDQTPPDIEEVEWEAFRDPPIFGEWYVTFTCDAVDETSGMDRVEMYINDGVYKVIEGDGPTYKFTIQWSSILKTVVFTFEHYDRAGNVIADDLPGDDVVSLAQYQQQQSNPVSRSRTTYQYNNRMEGTNTPFLFPFSPTD